MGNYAAVEKTLTQRLDAMEKGMSRLERHLDASGDTRDKENAIVKALMHRGGNAFAAYGNGDGAAEVSIVERANIASGGRQKSMGKHFGRDLQALWVASGGDPNKMGGWDGGDVHKHLDGAKWGAVNKGGLAEAAGSTGGYTLAPQYYMNLIRASVEEAQVRPKCTTIPMQSRSLFIPALQQNFTPGVGQSAYLGGLIVYWQPESATISQAQPNFRQIEMVARDMVFLTLASNQLLYDNAVALDSFLSTLFQEAMTWSYDYYILRGNGANQPMGLVNNPAAYVVTRGSAGVFAMADAYAMYQRLLVQSQKTACWLMHPSLMGSLIGMTNGATNSPFLVFLNPTPNSGEGGPMAQAMPWGYFMGLPLIFTEKLPALASGSVGSVILADLSKQLVGDRLAVQIEASPYPYFTSNQTVSPYAMAA